MRSSDAERPEVTPPEPVAAVARAEGSGPPTGDRSGQGLQAYQVLALQHAAGNQAVSRMLEARVGPAGPVLGRWTMPFLTSKSDDELVKDGAAGDVTAIKEIKDFGRATEEQKLLMVDHLCAQVLVGPRDERALESIWLGFGDDFVRVASANLPRWKLSAVRYTGISDRIPAVKALRTAFVKDIESVARDNLKQNREFAKGEMARFGIPEDEHAAAGALTPDASGELERMQDAADTVSALQWSQKAALGAVVGFREVLAPGDGKHWRPAKFDPFEPQPAASIPIDSSGSTWLYDEFTEQERMVTDAAEVPVPKPFADVKAKYEAAEQDIAGWVTAYPSLLALTRENDAAVTGGLARADSPEQARDKLGAALRKLLKDIATTEGKLGGDLDPLDLKPIHVRLAAKSATAESGTDWSQELPAAIAQDLLRDHDISNALRALGLQLVAHIAFLLAPFTGGASLFLLAAGTAALGANAVISAAQYTAMADAAKATPLPGTDLVGKDQVAHAKQLAESDAAAFALALVVLGASLAAAGMKAFRARQRPPVPEPEPPKSGPDGGGGGQPAGRQLTPGPPGKMLGEAIGKVKAAPPAGRAALMDDLIDEILEVDGGKSGWTATKASGPQGERLYIGGAGRTIVIDPKGQMFKGEIGNPRQFTPSGGMTFAPNYPNLEPIN